MTCSDDAFRGKELCLFLPPMLCRDFTLHKTQSWSSALLSWGGDCSLPLGLLVVRLASGSSRAGLGHCTFFLRFGALHAVLQYGLCKKLQCSSFVPFAPSPPPLRIRFLCEGLWREEELFWNFNCIRQNWEVRAQIYFIIKTQGYLEKKLFGLEATLTLALLTSVSNSKY